jgi:Smg protein
MFEVLMFLFENYMDGGSVALRVDDAAIVVELEKIGFERYEIDQALQWLGGLVTFQKAVLTGPTVTALAIRHYSREETECFGVEGKGFLLYLEQAGILDPGTREIVIDRLMALELREIDLKRIRWVVLVALFSQPDKKSALITLQDMILADAFDVLH